MEQNEEKGVKKLKKQKKWSLFICVVLFCLLSFQGKSFASNQTIKCQAKYKDAITYDITITGLEPEENREYYAIITLKKEVTENDFFKLLGNSLHMEYDKETKVWKTDTMFSLDGIKPHDEFERQGQYYLHIAKKQSSTRYEIIAETIPVETPALPPLGKRINIYVSAGVDTNYYIQVNALNTMLYNGVQRTIKFYLGEVTDKALLKTLSEKKEAAYEELLQYAKKQEKNLKPDSFQDTKTGVLDYNILANYPIEAGKHYFLHTILDDENGTYVPVEDIGIYNGEWNYTKNEGGLTKFSYVEHNHEEEEPKNNQQINEVANTQTENKQQPDKNSNILDNTVANGVIPQTGSTSIKTILLIGTVGIGILLYVKYKKYKEVQ